MRKKTAATVARAALLVALAATFGPGCATETVAPPTNLRVVVQPPPEPFAALMDRWGVARLRLAWDPSPTLAGGDGGRYVVVRVSGSRLDVRSEVVTVPADRAHAHVPIVYPIADPPPLFEVLAEGPEGGLSEPSASGLVRPPRFLAGVPLAHPNGAPDCVPPVSIAALQPDGRGGAWIGTRGGGLLHRDADGALRRWTTLDGLLDDDIRALAVAPGGPVWIGTRRGLQRLDPATGAVRTWTEASGGLRGGVTALALRETGTLWLATGGALARMTGTMDRPLILGEPLAEGQRAGTLLTDLRELAEQRAWQALVAHLPVGVDDIALVALDPGGGLWAAGALAGVLHRPAGALVWRRFPPPDASGPAAVRPTALAPAAAGAAWIGTDRGLFLLTEDGAWRPLPLLPEGPATRVGSLAPLTGDRVVAIVAGKPLLCSATPAPVCTLLPGAPARVARELTATAVARDGAVWFGARDGRIQRRPTPTAPPEAIASASLCGDAPPTREATAVGIDPRDRVWLASPVALGWRTPESGAWHVQRAGEAWPDVSLTALAFDRHGNVFAGTPMGVAVRFDEPPLWTVVEVPGGIAPPAAATLASGRRLWVGGPDGLRVFGLAGERTVRTVPIRGADRVAVTSLAARPDGGLWIGTRAGLFRWTAADGVQRADREAGGDADAPVDALGLDDAAGLWIATPAGLRRRSVLLGGVTRYALPDGWSDDPIVAIAPAGAGVALATRAGRLGCADSAGGRVVERHDLALAGAPVEVRGMAVGGRTAWLATRPLGLVAVPAVCPTR